jgi:hypothetical protein
MIYKTRSKRSVEIECLETKLLGDSAKDDLCNKLLEFASGNTESISYEYILKRLNSYSIICISKNGEEIVGFGFADFRNISISVLQKLPLLHFGLMIIGNEWRGDRLSRLISITTVKFLTKKVGPKIYLTGFAVSAKCSSPVSFYRLQQASLKLGFPKFNPEGELDIVSRSRFGKVISKSVSLALGLDQIEDFVISDCNANSGFQLNKENYTVNSPYEEKVLKFFKKNVIPYNEVLFLTYGHPLIAR